MKWATGSFRLKKSFEAADKVARCAVLVGEDEVASQVYTVKTFATGEQVKVARVELARLLSVAAENWNGVSRDKAQT